MIKLSIIIPIYNAENHLDRCVSSCINQGLKEDEYEILLCNDGSTDNSLAIAKALSQKHNYIKVFSQENAGAGMARNLGIKHALGRYVMFVDADDYINSLELNKYYQLAINKKLDLLRFAFKIYDSEGKFTISKMPQFAENQVYQGTDATLMDYTIGSACGTFFRRDFLFKSEVRFRNDMVHEDCEFMLRILPKAQRMMVLSVCLYTYCWNGNSTDRSKSVNNLIRLKKSDIYVAQSYFNTADKYPIGSPINNYYYRKGNSLVSQYLLSLINEKEPLSIRNRLLLLSFACIQGVYPVRRYRTLSWKTTLLLFFLNYSIIEKSLIKLFNCKKKMANN